MCVCVSRCNFSMQINCDSERNFTNDDSIYECTCMLIYYSLSTNMFETIITSIQIGNCIRVIPNRIEFISQQKDIIIYPIMEHKFHINTHALHTLQWNGTQIIKYFNYFHFGIINATWQWLMVTNFPSINQSITWKGEENCLRANPLFQFGIEMT